MPATLLKRESSIGVSLWICEIFQNSFYAEHLQATAFRYYTNILKREFYLISIFLCKDISLFFTMFPTDPHENIRRSKISLMFSIEPKGNIVKKKRYGNIQDLWWPYTGISSRLSSIHGITKSRIKIKSNQRNQWNHE